MTDGDVNPRTAFPAFYGNSHITKHLAPHRLWTVSDVDKRPINIVELLATGRLFGASTLHTEDQLLTLDELADQLPNAANCAIHFDSRITGTMLLDIEPSCPPELAARLLSLATGTASTEPTALYSEVSMSGRGYHLLMPMPANLAEHGPASRRIALTHPQGWFEILLYHWATFTREPVPHHVLDAAYHAQPVAWEDIFAGLATATKAAPTSHMDTSELLDGINPEAELTGLSKSVHDIVLRAYQDRWNRTLDDYAGDRSRWEFAQLTWLAREVEPVITPQLRMAGQPGPDHTHVVPIVYTLAKELIPYRDKHEQLRSGLPYLLYVTINAAATAALPQ